MMRLIFRGMAVGFAMTFLAALLTQCEPTPASCNAATCSSNQVRVCLDKCATVVEPNARCNLDLCASSARICGVGYFCHPNPSDPGFGTCSPNFQGLGAQNCTSDSCGTGLYCRSGQCNTNGKATCSLPVQSGTACDSNMGDGAKCAPCEPGTTCVKGFCAHACTNDDSCPCNAGYKCATATADAVPGYCYQCRNNGQACDTKNTTGSFKPCCDGSICQTRGTDQACCTPKDAACTTGGDCCNGLYCSGAKNCGACVGVGGGCTEDAACCGNKCTNGICTAQCTPGAACVVPNAKGGPGGYLQPHQRSPLSRHRRELSSRYLRGHRGSLSRLRRRVA
ncbi:hypothetical protein BH09MYX1_BH09MYX1_32250 [soil metagenome]